MAKPKQQKSRTSRQYKQPQLAGSQKKQSPALRKKSRRRTSNRRSWVLVGGVLVLIAVIVGIFFALSRQSIGGGTEPTPVSPTVLKTVTHVDPAVLAAVGTGGTQNTAPRSIKGAPLTGPTGKPEFFYFGAEWCPYCAAERWAVVVALSRFGTFSQLNETTSTADDVYPNTPTFTFYHSTYASSYIDFVPIETESNQRDATGNYVTLQTPTPEQQQLLNTYNPQSTFPFIDIANQYLVTTPGYSPEVLKGLSAQDIANSLSNEASPVAQGILGTANYLTAAICVTTHQQPTSVCNADPIPGIQQSLSKASIGANNTYVPSVTHPFEAVIRRPGTVLLAG